MNLEILQWIFGVLIIPLIVWCFWITTKVGSMLRITKETLDMHKDADRHGFGTRETNRLLTESHAQLKEGSKQMTAAMREMAHYMKWFCKAQTGEEPPPPVEGQ